MQSLVRQHLHLALQFVGFFVCFTVAQVVGQSFKGKLRCSSNNFGHEYSTGVWKSKVLSTLVELFGHFS